MPLKLITILYNMFDDDFFEIDEDLLNATDSGQKVKENGEH